MYYTEDIRELYEDYTSSHISGSICLYNLYPNHFYFVSSKDNKKVFLFKVLGKSNNFIILKFFNINDLDESKCITFNMTSPSLNRCEEVTSLAHSLFRQKKLNNILDEDISGDNSKV